jgi:hypothetical protein
MKKLLLTLCILLIATYSNAATHLEYQSIEEENTNRFTITVIEETPDTITYLSVSPIGSTECCINKGDGSTISWKRMRKNRSIEAIRKGNSIEVNVIENGQNRSKIIQAGNKIWIQKISLSLQWFVKDTSKDEMDFCIIKTNDLSLFEMVAIKKKDVDIRLGPKKFKAANVVVTLPGMKSILWKSNYWFQKNDGLFLRYKGTNGPGTPLTITQLVVNSNSVNEN